SANCTISGALLHLRPIGVLPQNRLVRVVLASGFADIAGQALAADLVVGTFPVGVATDPGTTTPGDAADELLEGFASGGPGSGEDMSTPLELPRASWGANGELVANLGFDGTGGPGGNFDWQIGNDTGSPETFILDTTFSVITNVTQTATEAVVNGVVDIRSLV